MTVGENIRRLRKEKGLTQKQLGELCGINEVQIRRYELGGKNSNPKIETIRKIANALGVYMNELLEGNWEEYQNQINDDFSVREDVKEKELLENYRQLNPDGQTEARKRVQELTEIKKYTVCEELPTD